MIVYAVTLVGRLCVTERRFGNYCMLLHLTTENEHVNRKTYHIAVPTENKQPYC